MEGQGFNPMPGATPTPTPEPTPTPAPEPTPEMTFVSEPTAAEPVPQDSFAEPAANTGASWQPAQATAPSSMSAPAAAPAPEPKKGNMGLIIAIIAAAVILVGLIIAIIVVLATGNNNGSSSSKSGSNSKTADDPEKTKDYQKAQRNTQREDDLARLITAVNDFQTNNNGKTPFNGLDMAQFVKRYIDIDCTGGASSVKSTYAGAATSFTECGAQFTDPDGEAYNLVYEGKVTSSKKVNLSNMDHKFHVYSSASCGNDEGTVDTGRGEREIAVFYVLEGGEIACNDNH